MTADKIEGNKIKFTHTTIFKREDGIIEVQCGDDVNYQISHFKEMNDLSAELCEYKPQLILFKVGNYTTISNEAREYGATAEATKYSIAEAYVIRSLPQKIVANFYIRVDKPNVPTKFFNNEYEAVEWLNEFRPKQPII